MIDKIVNKVKAKFELIENDLDENLLLNYPEMWRRGYARAFRRVIEFLVISFPILILIFSLSLIPENYIASSIRNTSITLTFGLILLLPLGLMIGFVFLFLGGESDIFEREFHNIEHTEFSYDSKEDKKILWINFGLVAFGHLYAPILFVMCLFFMSFLFPKKDKIPNSDLPSQEAKILKEDIRVIVNFELFYLTNFQNYTIKEALDLVNDSIFQKLPERILDAKDLSIYNDVLKHYDPRDSSKIKDQYIIITSEDLNGLGGENFLSARKSYDKILEIITKRYPIPDFFFLNFLVILLFLYLRQVAKWMKKAYFRDIQARRFNLSKPNRILKLVKILYKWVKKLIGLILVIIFFVYMQSIEVRYNPDTPDWVIYFLKALFETPYKILKDTDSSLLGIALIVFLLLFIVRYLFIFPENKRKLYRKNFSPEYLERNIDYKRRIAMTELDRIREDIQIKKKGKWFYQIENFFLINLPELWRRDTTNSIRLILKLTFFFVISTILISGVISYLRTEELIGDKLAYQLVSLFYVFSFLAPLFVWIVFYIQKDVGVKIQYSRYAFFNFSNERILLLVLFSMAFLIIQSLNLSHEIMYRIISPHLKDSVAKELFYNRVSSTGRSSDKQIEAVIKGEYYFQKTFNNSSDSLIIEDLYELFLNRVDSIVYPLASNGGIKKIISDARLDDSLEIKKMYHNVFLSDTINFDTSLSFINMRIPKNDILEKIKNKISAQRETDLSFSTFNKNLYYLGVFIIISCIYFMDTIINEMNASINHFEPWGDDKKKVKLTILTILFLLFVLIPKLFLLWLGIFAIIFYPYNKYQIYKHNYSPRENTL